MVELLDPGQPDGGWATRIELRARLAALEGKLASLAAIEQAKGALMVTYGLSADAAFALLRFHSQTRNVKVRAIADELTSLMQSSPTSTEATARFDRLLDDVALSLQARTVAPPPDLEVSDQASEADVAPWPDLPAGELEKLMLRSVATAPPGITIAANAPGKPLIYANDAFTEITGYRMAEVLGRNCKFLQGPDTDQREIAALSQAMYDGRDISVVVRNYRRDRSPFWNEVSISPIRNHVEQITHFVGTQIDVTDRFDRDPARAGTR